ncbi:hypothetical protein H4R19_001974 [Coemansia spiralis]|nr:hypothetical protein H4R19_001974 [Coemansia spiralis]
MNPGRVPRGVSLLCCGEIRLPPSLASRQQRTAAPTAEATAGDAGEAVAQIWMPLRAARQPEPARTAYTGREAAAASLGDGHDAALLNAWLCPEISARIQRERARRRRALQIAERMGALVQAERDREHQDSNGDAGRARGGRGRKRQHSSPSPPPPSSPGAAQRTPTRKPALLLPTSPELVRPQSLLIPELLPKGMLRVRPAADADSAAATLACRASEPGTGTGPASSAGVPCAQAPQIPQTAPSGSAPSLGLDLGFDIARPASSGAKWQQGGSLGGSAAAILEIADFLEKDIDVFTPTAVARTPRSAVFSVPVLPPISATSAGPLHADKQQELIDDILNMSFARHSP